MSGSSQKKLRQGERAQNAGLTQKEIRKKQKGRQPLSKRQKQIFRITAVVLCVLLVLGVATIIFFSSGAPVRMYTAVKVGDVELSAAEYNYYLHSTYYGFVNQNQTYLTYMGLDTSKPLSQQQYYANTEQTWQQYFEQTTESQITYTFALVGEAKKNNFTLSETDEKLVDEYMDEIKEYCSQNNLRETTYLKQQYGRGVTMDTVREQYRLSLLAYRYEEKLKGDYTFSENETLEAYNKNKDSFDLASFRFAFLSGEAGSDSTEEPTEEETLAAMEAAKQKADEMLNRITTEADFAVLAREYQSDEDRANGVYDEDDSTLQKSLLKSQVSELNIVGGADWVFAAERVSGDKTVLEAEGGYYVFYFISRERQETNVVDVRHILLQPSSTVGTGGLSDEQAAECEAQAQTVYDEWKAGAKTEDSFAALANEHSVDPGSNTVGGLYKKVYPGQMVPTFNDWCFDAARKPGDTGIVMTDYGAHIMYFVSAGDPYWEVQSQGVLTTEKFNAYFDELSKSYSVSRVNSGFGYVDAL